ncbi:conserved hypothetical protein [Oleispira antarctica RB-8]|uniref:N-acetyltransferase domain-containing protein n=1 Tax=Oleispira antarctica RB-8 TaxID=698738 RepID=R4YK33_OLEAN|nr:conserved hypothetical protein [Oleispira antarctica RB-8]
MSQRYTIRLAQAEDSAALLQLINDTPQEGSISLNFERQPNFFHATGITTSDPEVWLMEDLKHSRLVASFSIGKRKVYVNGKQRLTRYGNDLRIHQDYKGGRTLFRLFKKYKELMQEEWMQTVILDENKASIDTVGSGRLSLPIYHSAGQFITHMVALNKSYTSSDKHVRRASLEDINEMQNFFDQYAKQKEFYPCYDFKKIGSDDIYYRNLNISDYFLYYNQQELVGVVGSWNQKEFKQTRFLSYHGSMKWLRHINNISSKILGGLSLPAPGTLANYINLHSILIKDNQPEILRDMLLNILSEYSNSTYDALIIGFDKRDPLHKALQGFKSHTLTSNHYLASYGEIPDVLKKQVDQDTTTLFHLEPSRL